MTDSLKVFDSLSWGRGREGKGREGKARQGKGREGKGREGKGREGKTFDVSLMRSQALHRAAQELACNVGWGEGALCLGTHDLPEARCRPLQCNHEVLYAL